MLFACHFTFCNRCCLFSPCRADSIRIPMLRPSRSILISARSLVLLGFLLSSAGCGRISFVSERYDNFTAYYNTFYNAERSFREGVEVLDQTTAPIDRREYIDVFPAPEQAVNDQKFQASIDKSADVLRDHPNSKWIDDALVLIGKSYYYQRNYVSAEQKFREAIDLGSALEDEARLWLARTLIASGSHDEARDHLQTSLGADDLSARWEPSLRLALGELHVKRGAFEEAVDELAAGLEDIRDNRLEARGWFLLGQVYETLGRYEEAVDAFDRVTGAHPRYELSYAAQLSAVRIEGLYVDGDSALRKLRRMERDDKNYTSRFELAYVRGLIYQSEGYAGDARALYQDILYGSDGQISNVRGRIHYALGELYRDAYNDYQTAAAHFDTARTAIQEPASSAGGGTSIEPQYAPEAITDASLQADMFGSFALVSDRIAEMDSLLHLGELSDEEFSARILEIRTEMAAQQAEEERRLERLQAEQGFQNAATSAANRQQSSSAQNEATGSAGFLFHSDPVRVQEGRMNFIVRWGDRPHAPNWRRLAAIENVAASVDSAGRLPEERLRDLDPSVGENPLPPIDYADVPRDSLSRAALRARRAAARYELANVLFLSMDLPDSAATWYRAVIEEDAEFPVAQRAYYALAEVHRSLGDSLSARRLYEQVLRDYPESDFAGRVREQLGIRMDVPSDTLALAEEDYERGFQWWRRGAYSDALNHMVEVAASYRGLEVAPRALLAAGRIYLEWADRDSLDIYGPLPLSVPDSVLGEAGLLKIARESSPDSMQAEPGKLRPDSTASTEDGVPVESDVPADADAAAGDDPAVASDDAPAANDDAPAGADDVIAVRDDVTAAGGDTSSVGEDAPESREDLAVSRDGARRSDEAVSQQPPVAAARLTVGDDGETARDGASTGESADSLVRESPNNGPAALDADDQLAQDTIVGSTTDSLAALQPDSSLFDGAGAPPPGDASQTGLAQGDSVFAGPQLLAAAGADDEIYLKTLYAGVKQNYPSTAYSVLADQLLSALEERQVELKAAADSIAAAAERFLTDSSGVLVDSTLADSQYVWPDSVRADESILASDSSLTAESLTGDPSVEVNSLAEADTSVAPRSRLAVDSSAASDPPAAADSNMTPVSNSTPISSPADTLLTVGTPRSDIESDIPNGDEAILGEGGIRVELGGYTLLLGMATNRSTMTSLAEKYAKDGFRTDVITEDSDGKPIYRAVLGHFATRREAGMMMQKYKSHILEDIQPIPLDNLK